MSNLLKYINKFFQVLGMSKKPKSHEELLETISTQLEKVKNEILEYIPDQLKSDFRDDSFISGGCIYSLYREQEPKDYDFFLRDRNLASQIWSFFNELAEHKGAKISGGMYKGLPLIVTDNAVSIGKYQIITQWIGTPEETISQFDFKHLMFWWSEGDQIQTLSDWKYLVGSELVYNEMRARDIVGSIVRSNKFVSRGMRISNKEISKILLRLNEIGFSERELKILNDSKSNRSFGS